MASIQSISINNFAAYGLNRKRNFLRAPDCGGKAVVCLESVDDVREFCTDMLMEHNCPESAIFCSFQNGKYMAVVKQPVDFEDEDGECLLFAIKPTKDREMFSEIDSEFRLCCYGMLTETKPGEWRIEE